MSYDIVKGYRLSVFRQRMKGRLRDGKRRTLIMLTKEEQEAEYETGTY